MNPAQKPTGNKPFTLIAAVLIFQALLYHVAPALLIRVIDNPDVKRKILWHYSNEWNNIEVNEFSTWVNSDGSSDKDVSILPLPNGVQVINNTPEWCFREGYFLNDIRAGRIFKLHADINANRASEYGLVFHGDVAGQYYVFLVSDDEYTVEILPRENNSDLFRKAIIEITPLPDQVNHVESISVMAYENRYFLYINDIYVDQFMDTRLQGNRIGIEIFGCVPTSFGETENTYWNYSLQQPVSNPLILSSDYK